MPNPKPYIIQPHQRGHRKRVSDEPTRTIAVRVPESVYLWVMSKGSGWIRDRLKALRDIESSSKP